MSLSIDEAIRHAENKARELGCTECAQEHRQLAAWLRELKFRRAHQAALDAARWRADIEVHGKPASDAKRYKV